MRPIQMTSAAFMFTVALGALLQGCAINMEHGLQVTEAQASAFTVGTTTLADVVKALGKPPRSNVLSNGQTLFFYAHSQTRVNPPSVGTMTGTSPRSEVVSSDVTIFLFDTDLKLARVSRSASLPSQPVE